jgi:hypothetical protein
VIIATDVKARVTLDKENNGPTGDGAIAPLCAKTPCAVTLPSGDYRLKFSGLIDEGRSSSVELKVRSDTEVLNHRLGQERENDAVQTIGAGIVVLGGLVAAYGWYGYVVGNLLTESTSGSERSAREERASTYGTVALLGLLGAAIGTVLIVSNPSIRQAGSTTQRSPETARSK